MAAGGQQHFVLGGVAVQAQIARFASSRELLLVLLDNHEPLLVLRQILGQRTANPPKAADDGVANKLVDFLFHQTMSHDIFEFSRE